jgi:hypothetical protein
MTYAGFHAGPTVHAAAPVETGYANLDAVADLAPGQHVDHRVAAGERARVRPLGTVDLERWAACVASADDAGRDLF